MGSLIRSFFQSLMKLFNAIVAMAGIAMVIYSMWMIHAWHRQTGQLPFDESDYPVPWFIYSFLGVGIMFCVITCSGHIAAETISGCCLYILSKEQDILGRWYSYNGVQGNGMRLMHPLFLLLVLEGVLLADVFLNRNWKQDFPKDATGNFYELEKFIRENFDFCKWIGLSVLIAQGLSFLLAMILKALGPHRERCYDSDEEYASTRPLLRNPADPPSYVVVDPHYGGRK